MSSNVAQVLWLPLVEYASKHGVSLSTLRRHIKANKIIYKIENGRYLLLDDTESDSHKAFSASSAYSPVVSAQVMELNFQLQKAREEIAELKTLIACYEEGLLQQPNLGISTQDTPRLDV